jgi:uncharacterized membrane protein YkoI
VETKTMQKRWKLAIGVAAVGLAGAAGTGIAVASGVGDDDGTERPITGDALAKASAAALAHTGGGEVTETEVGDEESKYEVEVTLDDGSQVDVQLDANFHVVGSEGDDDSSDDGGSDD